MSLTPETARLQNCELETKHGPVNIGGDPKGKNMEASWELDVLETGKYVVELVFSCDTGSVGALFEFGSGGSIFTWKSQPTAGWNFFQKRHICTLDLKKGRQTFSLKGKSSRGLAVRSLRLLPDPGTVVALPAAGSVCELDGNSANLGGAYQDKDGLICGIRDGETFSWNLSSPEERKYNLVLVYASPESGVTCELEISPATGLLQAVLPATRGWRDIKEYDAGLVTIPKGNSKLTFVKKKGSLDFKAARLVFSEKLEAEINALREKPRLGMTLQDLEKIWGSSSPGGGVDIERRGGKDDLDGSFFKGLAPLVKTFSWDKDGLKITAVLWEGHCIAIGVNMADKSLKAAREVASVLMPGVSFNWGRNETSYSSNKAYKMQYWGSSFDIKASGLVQSIRDELAEKGETSQNTQASSSSGYSPMGRSLEELKTIWGNGEVRDGSNIEYKGDKNDIDWELYEAIKPETMAYRWMYPQKNNLHVTAVFYRNRCIALDISQRNGFSAKELMEKVREFLPGVTFGSVPQEKGAQFTVYSTSHDRGYKFQNWDGYFELKASGLIRELQKEHEKDLREAAAKIYRQLQSVQKEKKGSLFGKTPAEMDALLGVSVQKGDIYRKKPVRVWNFPGSSLEFHGAFASLGDREVCCHLLIVDRLKGLTSSLAFPLAQQAVVPFSLKSVPRDDMKTWFSTVSKDQGERFFVEWYNDPSTRATMCITDMVALKAWEQAEKGRKNEEKEKLMDKVKRGL